MLANYLFRLRNKLFDSPIKNRFARSMKPDLGKVLCLGLGMIFSVASNAQPVITIQPANQTAVFGGSAVFSVMVTGVGPFTYQWRLSGTNLPNRNNIITRAAGGGVGSAFSGDGGVATSASLWNPTGVALDSAGDLFIADSANERIRMVDTNFVSTTNGLIGNIRTMAGSGTSAYSGDGGLATNAGLTCAAVAVDGFGNFYIADQSAGRIRKVDTNGIISTVAGTNSSGFTGDGGPAPVAKLNVPLGVIVDALGNLFIADWLNNRIRKVDTNGIITTVAGTNSAGFAGDGGLAVNAKLNRPAAVAVDGFGNLFIADMSNNRIRKVDASGFITTLAGTNTAAFSGDGGTATNASLNQPNGVAVDTFGDVFISDYANNRIRMVNTAGNITTVAGNGGTGNAGDGGLASNATIYQPHGVSVDFYGNFYVVGYLSSTIRKVDLGRAPMLQLLNVAATNAGNYDVVITSPSGSVTSSIVSLTLLLPPSITTQPVSITAASGSSANFNVTVTNNPPFSYQWFTSSGRTATAVPYVSGGHVQFVFMRDVGAGYVSPPQVHFIGGSGSGAAGTAWVSAGSVSQIIMFNQGSGYTTPPTIQIDPPTALVNTTLIDQTNSPLTLPSVTSGNSTNYFVVVTNNYGSVTSSAATLFVFLSPQNLTVQNVAVGLQMQFAGTPYYRYSLQSATNLTPPTSWISIFTNTADVNGNWQFTDTNLNAGQKFYRAEGQ